VAILVRDGRRNISSRKQCVLMMKRIGKIGPCLCFVVCHKQGLVLKHLETVLAWVVVLAGYKPTPAEEMDGVHNGGHEGQREMEQGWL